MYPPSKTSVARAGGKRPQPQVVPEVVLMALRVQRRAADQRHHVEALGFHQPHAARKRREDRAGNPPAQRARDQGAALGVAQPDAVGRHEDDASAPGRAGCRRRGGLDRSAGDAEQLEDRLAARQRPRPRLARTCSAIRREVRKDLGVEEAVEPEDAGRRSDEGVVVLASRWPPLPSKTRRPGHQQVRGEHLQPVAAAGTPEEDADVRPLGESAAARPRRNGRTARRARARRSSACLLWLSVSTVTRKLRRARERQTAPRPATGP